MSKVPVEEIRGLYHEALQNLRGFSDPQKIIIGILTALRYGLPINVFVLARVFGLPYHEKGLAIMSDLTVKETLEVAGALKDNINAIRTTILTMSTKMANVTIGEYERSLSAVLTWNYEVVITDENGRALDGFSTVLVVAFALTVARIFGLKLSYSNVSKILSLFSVAFTISEYEYSLIRKLAYYIAYRNSYIEEKIKEAMKIKLELWKLFEKEDFVFENLKYIFFSFLEKNGEKVLVKET